MRVYFVRGEDIFKGKLTGRKFNDKYEIKCDNGTYQYTREYKELKNESNK